jgi:hypothetical protein
LKKATAFEFGHLNVKGVHALQNMFNGINLSKLCHPIFLLTYERYIEGQQLKVANPNNGKGTQINLCR